MLENRIKTIMNATELNSGIVEDAFGVAVAFGSVLRVDGGVFVSGGTVVVGVGEIIGVKVGDGEVVGVGVAVCDGDVVGVFEEGNGGSHLEQG